MNTSAKTTVTNWQELMVADDEGDSAGTLGDLVFNAPANLDNAVIDETGRIVEWPQFFIHVENEDPDFDTPRDEVNWDGLREALGR